MKSPKAMSDDELVYFTVQQAQQYARSNGRDCEAFVNQQNCQEEIRSHLAALDDMLAALKECGRLVEAFAVTSKWIDQLPERLRGSDEQRKTTLDAIKRIDDQRKAAIAKATGEEAAK